MRFAGAAGETAAGTARGDRGGTPHASPPPLDARTLKYATLQLQERLRAVETYGAGGCPKCHDAELRAAIATLKQLLGQIPAART